jgi:hypothetical protein
MKTYSTQVQEHIQIIGLYNQKHLFFKGTYADSTWYKLNDVVSYGGKQYRTTTAHTSSSAVLNQANFQQYNRWYYF